MENSAVIMKATTKLMSGVKVGGMVCVSNTSTLPDGSNPAGSVAELMAAELRLKIAGVTVMNTMLLNLLALENSSEAENSFGTELMREAFSRLTDMDILLFICPAKARIHEFISSTFTLDKSEFSVEGLVDKKIYKLRREDVLPRLRVRRAGVEDNDDLLPIVRAKNREEGVEESNDFFLANLIQNQNEVNHVFVGLDKNDTPVGILCTTREVDITSLSKVYDLSRLPGLKSMGVLPKAEVTKQKPILILIVGEISMIGTELLREGALSLGFLYFSGQEVQDGTQSLESSSNFEESVNAFFYRIEKLLHPLSGPKPRGCVIGGFPTK